METHEERLKYIREAKDHPPGCNLDGPADGVRSYVGVCACGSDEVADLLLAALLFCDAGDERFQTQGAYTNVGTELAVKVIDAEGLAEHGTGIGWAWTTPEGKQLVALLHELWPEEMKTVDWHEYFPLKEKKS